MKTSDFFFDLPRELIAQEPLAERSASRMMVLQRSAAGTDVGLRHHYVRDLPEFLREGDLLVVNDTKVIPVRLFGTRDDTRGKVEMMLVEELKRGVWDAYYKASGRQKEGICFTLADGQIRGSILAVGQGGGRVQVSLSSERPILEILNEAGVMPLPPYIRRDLGDPRTEADRARYQAVYAKHPGAVAAPTAGLHVTEALLSTLKANGVGHCAVTLHVGPGTFRPVSAENVEDHDMESERFVVTPETADAVNECRARGGRIVAVGSTSVRVLESVVDEKGRLVSGEGRTNIFIKPPYRFRLVDCLLTNFHLPQSTLLMMVSAFLEAGHASTGSGLAQLKQAYAEAIAERYRFYSYGDCMLIL